jgi:hypothetical protein
MPQLVCRQVTHAEGMLVLTGPELVPEHEPPVPAEPLLSTPTPAVDVSECVAQRV